MSTVKINAGGVIFETKYETLCRAPYFADMLANCDKDATIPFLDCDPEAFRCVLEYLRFPDYKIPTDYLYLCKYLLIELPVTKEITVGTLDYWVEYFNFRLHGDAMHNSIQNHCTLIKYIFNTSSEILLKYKSFQDSTFFFFKLIILNQSIIDIILKAFSPDIDTYFKKIENKFKPNTYANLISKIKNLHTTFNKQDSPYKEILTIVHEYFAESFIQSTYIDLLDQIALTDCAPIYITSYGFKIIYILKNHPEWATIKYNT